jgi:hypothetical protein
MDTSGSEPGSEGTNGSACDNSGINKTRISINTLKVKMLLILSFMILIF